MTPYQIKSSEKTTSKTGTMMRIIILTTLFFKLVDCLTHNECGTSCELRQQFQNTISEMNQRMVNMERTVDQLRQENMELKQRMGAYENQGSQESGGRNSSVSQRNRRLLINNDTPVAFLASLNALAKEEHLGVNQNIIYDTLLTNIGGGFNINHGIFTVPQSGIYLISATILTYVDNEARASIVVNGKRTVSLFAHAAGGRHEQGTQVAVLNLKMGDTVSVENIDLADATLWGERYTSFTGVLLFATE